MANTIAIANRERKITRKHVLATTVDLRNAYYRSTRKFAPRATKFSAFRVSPADISFNHRAPCKGKQYSSRRRLRRHFSVRLFRVSLYIIYDLPSEAITIKQFSVCRDRFFLPLFDSCTLYISIFVFFNIFFSFASEEMKTPIKKNNRISSCIDIYISYVYKSTSGH